MSYPEKFLLGNRKWEYGEVSGLATTSEADGLTLPAAQKVLVSSEIAGQYKAEVIVHELLHACFRSAGLDSTEAGGNEELIVSLLAPAVLDLLSQNRSLVQYILRVNRGS